MIMTGDWLPHVRVIMSKVLTRFFISWRCCDGSRLIEPSKPCGDDVQHLVIGVDVEREVVAMAESLVPFGTKIKH